MCGCIKVCECEKWTSKGTNSPLTVVLSMLLPSRATFFLFHSIFLSLLFCSFTICFDWLCKMGPFKNYFLVRIYFSDHVPLTYSFKYSIMYISSIYFYFNVIILAFSRLQQMCVCVWRIDDLKCAPFPPYRWQQKFLAHRSRCECAVLLLVILCAWEKMSSAIPFSLAHIRACRFWWF